MQQEEEEGLSDLSLAFADIEDSSVKNLTQNNSAAARAVDLSSVVLLVESSRQN